MFLPLRAFEASVYEKPLCIAVDAVSEGTLCRSTGSNENYNLNDGDWFWGPDDE